VPTDREERGRSDRTLGHRTVAGGSSGAVAPSPYYDDGGISIYCGDALDILPVIERGSVSAVVTDPPYVIGAVSAGNMASKSGGWADMMNSSGWFTGWYREVDRVLHRRGSFWTFLNWRTVPVVMRAALDARLPVTSMMVWDKQWIGPGGVQGLRPSYELCALLAQPDFAVKDRGIADVWQHKVGSYKATGHPAEKPEPLVRRILATCQLGPGETVVDPFLGSGTTAVAAKALGLRCIGIEAEEANCEIAAERLSQGLLFEGLAA
jgi:site-specific DNA-methyltransferase (adenine-specific)